MSPSILCIIYYDISFTERWQAIHLFLVCQQWREPALLASWRS